MSVDGSNTNGVRPAPCENEETFDRVEDALIDLWNTVDTLSKIRPPAPKYYRVTLFGSARIKPGDPVYHAVRDLSASLSAAGCDIVSGGGPGLMQAANEGENLGDPDNATRSIGVGVELPFEDKVNPFVEKVFHHQTFFTRLHHFLRLSNAFVIVNGGIGTTLEAMMVWQLLQVRHIHDMPFLFVGPMWRGLVEWARATMLTADPPLASTADLAIPRCVDTLDEAVEILLAHKAATYDRGRWEP